MPRFTIIRESVVAESFRNSKVHGMFDIPSEPVRRFEISGEIPIENEDWNIGMIFGASGSGKSTIAHHCFPDQVISAYEWSAKSIIDNFAEHLSVQQIVDALTAVGLSSSPVWLLPFAALSNGQQFRATLARAIAENDFIVFDEFTSVVDRIVAKAACVSVAKYLKKNGKKFIAVTCHDDILNWLTPDWSYNVNTGTFARDCLRRPTIDLQIIRGQVSDWPQFHSHHYMTSGISPAARCFLAYVFIDNYWNLVGFFSVLPAMGMEGWRRGHRTVVLPDFQGLGIGNKMIEAVAEHLYQYNNIRFRATTSAPGIIHHRRKRPDMWRMVNGPQMKPASANKKMKIITSSGRLTTTWEYIPSALRK